MHCDHFLFIKKLCNVIKKIEVYKDFKDTFSKNPYDRYNKIFDEENLMNKICLF